MVELSKQENDLQSKGAIHPLSEGVESQEQSIFVSLRLFGLRFGVSI